MGNKTGIILFIFSGFFISLLIVYLTKTGRTETFLLWIASIGVWGHVVIFALYLISSFPLPLGTTPLALSTGFLYGVEIGFLSTLVSSVSGAFIAFLACRTLLKRWVTEFIRKKQTLSILMKAVDKHAFKLCLIIRSSPIPFGLQNALFSVSNIQTSTYFLSTFLGLIPEQLVLVYMGSTAKDITEILTGSVERAGYQQMLLFVQFMVCVILLTFLIYVARKAFNEAIKEIDINVDPLTHQIYPLDLVIQKEN